MLFVKNKDENLRLCIDYKKLNKVTVKNKYPSPSINYLFDQMKEAKVFTKMELTSNYQQVRIKEEHIHKIVFSDKIWPL